MWLLMRIISYPAYNIRDHHRIKYSYFQYLVWTFAQFRRTFGAFESYERNMKTDTDYFNADFGENLVELTHNDRPLIYL